MVGVLNEGIGSLPGLSLQSLQEFLAQILFASLRVGSFLLASPLFGARFVLLPVRILVSFSLVLMIVTLNPNLPSAEFIASADGVLAGLKEIIIGLCAGLILTIIFGAASLAGEKIASSSGLAMATAVDPTSGASSPVMAQILQLFLLVIFMSLDGHLAVIRTIIESYNYIPFGYSMNAELLTTAGISAGDVMFKTATVIMLPFVIVLLLINVSIGVITRSAPTLNIFSFAFPVTIMAVFFIIYLSVSTLGTSLANLAGEAIFAMQEVLEGMLDG